MKFGILGTGMVAEYHKAAISYCADMGASLVAVGHYDPSRFPEIADEFGVPCASENDLLEDSEIDTICICTPSGQHAQQTLRAARAGKHVLVEKPMALSLSDADRMIDECEKAGVKLGVVFQRRAEPLFRKINAAITGGDFGDLTMGLVSMPYMRDDAYYGQAEWRGTWTLDGGGVLMNQGIHLIDLLVWYMGDPVDISASARTLHRTVEVEDVASASLTFENGSVASIIASTVAGAGYPHRLELYGTNGGFQVEGEVVTRWEVLDTSRETVAPPALRRAESAGSAGDPRGIALAGHTGIFRDFIQACMDDRSPMVDGLEGRRSLATVLGIYRAAGILPG
jgi:predicted dehydrogenase